MLPSNSGLGARDSGFVGRTKILLFTMLCLAVATQVSAQEPATRAEELAREREEKSKQLTPPQSGRVERTLLSLESGRFFERLLAPPEGFYPKIGNITAGSGFALGPGYRHAGILGERADFSTFAAVSLQRYWMIDARLTFPALADGRVFADVHGRLFDFPSEDFFGVGPESRREDETTYTLHSSQVGAVGGVRPASWLTLGTSVDYLTPSISAGRDGQTIGDLFTAAQAPGLDIQPDFVKLELSADVNTREPRGNPRRGGQYKIAYERYNDLDLDSFSFNRVNLDLQHYIPLLRDRRVLALHAVVSTSNADAGQTVPFYYQRTLGGPDDLRGFRRFRFRDDHTLLLQAEYRWEIFTAMDGAIFYDAGKVASRREDLDLEDLEHDYGIGFRFGTRNGVFLRVEGAFGSNGGKHFIMRFGHVF
ncbi:MAG: BamA/TamA family outer membrane protein [Acidobacteria bacterium]|nr:BamA/TamA family outer membrane protein [Acidobacteriota bacterium]